MDARFGFLWGSDPRHWDWSLLRGLVTARGCVLVQHLPRRFQSDVALACGEQGLLLQRRGEQWEVTL